MMKVVRASPHGVATVAMNIGNKLKRVTVPVGFSLIFPAIFDHIRQVDISLEVQRGEGEVLTGLHEVVVNG